MSLHDPQNFALIVRGMIDIQKHEGWLPECREANQMQFIQGGSRKLIPLFLLSTSHVVDVQLTSFCYSQTEILS
jgi:hypothetical protein